MVNVGETWKWKGSNDSGFKIESIATHPCKNIETRIIVYTPVNCYVTSSFYRDEHDFEEVMERVCAPVEKSKPAPPIVLEILFYISRKIKSLV